ncbi:MAG: pyruvate dehydrogenase (acetyl-transferring) E1 component subunit alpha [Candidatus Aenigmatarchaeota archaeon]|nr:MAG: pyruvate dehydrogenase (acetyl-transferring) E1 component subunit alpha [Candidatus Aenigmarchaeota archaeon]
MRKTLAKFSVEYLQILDENGRADETLMPVLGDARVREFYEQMVRGRVFDETALALQREGRMGTYASIRGQEASNVGPALAMDKEDWLFPAFREDASMVARGVSMEALLRYWGWDERGNDVRDVNVFPVAVPVSTQIPHAAGFAWAMKLRKKRVATLVYFGDGATSKGDFAEALNLAGVFNLPVVFVCQNNQWAISVPRAKQSAAETLAQKAIAYGFPGIQVDGNDVFATYVATKEAIRRAKEGNGPTLIECFTYRMSDHTTADDAKKYRDAKQVAEWEKKDPIKRLQLYMKAKGLWSESYERALREQTRKEVDEAVKKYESMPPAQIEDMFRYTYAEMTPQLKEQLGYLKKSIEETKSTGGANR